jgi:hypothetical protein
MQRLGNLALAVVGAAFFVHGAPAWSQTQKPGPNDDDNEPRIDTAAMNALTRMGNYLRTLNAFQVKANVTTEEVLENGQKIQLASRLDAVADRPNKLRVQLSSDRKQRLFFFDGKNFTLFAPRQNFYSTVAAPGTIGSLADMLEQKYSIDLPFVDLFRWGTSDAPTKDITDATDIGASEIEGVTCQHYAFRQEGLDWQVWIQNGEFPLPRKLVITTLTDSARPQHEALYTWNLAPSFDSTTFVFTAPKDAKQITMADADKIRQQLNKRSGGNDQ